MPLSMVGTRVVWSAVPFALCMSGFPKAPVPLEWLKRDVWSPEPCTDRLAGLYIPSTFPPGVPTPALET